MQRHQEPQEQNSRHSLSSDEGASDDGETLVTSEPKIYKTLPDLYSGDNPYYVKSNDTFNIVIKDNPILRNAITNIIKQMPYHVFELSEFNLQYLKELLKDYPKGPIIEDEDNKNTLTNYTHFSKAYSTLDNNLKLAYPRLHIEYEGYYEMLAGTANLINKLYEFSYNDDTQTFEDVTLVFLDKSGRNSAYLLRRMLQELKDAELITQEINIQIKFLNVGRNETHKDMFDPENIIDQDNPNNPKGKVMVLDEFSATGESLHRGVEIIEKINGVTHILPFSISKLQTPWFTAPILTETGLPIPIKGVDDLVPPQTDDPVYDLSNNEEYLSAFNKYIGGHVSVPYSHPFSKTSQNEKIPDEYIKLIHKLNVLYRKMLKEMVKAYVDEIKKGS